MPEVLYRGPAKGGLQHDGNVYYPGDLITLDEAVIASLMRKGGHVFQHPDGDIVRAFELGAGGTSAVSATDRAAADQAASERAARLAAAQARAHRTEASDPVPTSVQNEVIATGGDPDKIEDPAATGITNDAGDAPGLDGDGKKSKK